MIYVFGEYELDTRLFELRHAGELCPLEPQVFNVLAFLLQHRDRVVSKDELLENLWPDRFVSEATLSHRLMEARKAVGDSGRAQRLIKTLHGRGYRFVGAVEEHDPESPGQAADALSSTASDLREPRREDGGTPSASIDSTPFGAFHVVGRGTELGHLHQWLDKALGGARQAVFVTGEAGLGKTTLVDTFVTQAKSKGRFWVGHGQCLEHRGVGEAYMPVLEALGRMCREPDGRDLIGLLARQAPTWLVQMPWLVNEEELAALQQKVLGATRERMLREMVEAIEALTLERPLVLVVEDLHWSDYSTVDLISWLARRREPARFLLLGTYRPADVKASGHPLHTVQQELRIRGHCSELALTNLREEAVQEYLSARFPKTEFPDGLAQLVGQRTHGNPLFIENVVESWISQGALEKEGGGWSLRVKLDELAVEVPESARQLIEQQLGQLKTEDHEILEAASVAGMEFSAAAVAAGVKVEEEAVEVRCDALARQDRFVRSSGTAEWPDGTVSAHYGFIHDLYQEVLYDRVPAGRKARLHQQIGERLEKGCGPHVRERAAELAMHFVRGRDSDRAVRYLQFSAEQAFQRSAHREAIDHLTQGLEHVSGMPDTPERQETELNLLAALAPALIATKGWAAQELEQTFNRAQELCQQLEDPPQLSRVWVGRASMHELRGEYAESEALLERHLHRREAGLVLESRELLACSTFHQGKFPQALDHAELGLSIYDATQTSEMLAQFAENPGVCYHDWAALSLWFMGYPDQALDRAQKALDLAQEHSYSLTTAQAQAAVLHQCRREEAKAEQWAEATVGLAAEQGFPHRLAMGRVLRGWALSAQGNIEQGIEELRQGMAGCRAIGAEMDRPYHLALQAEACGLSDQVGAGIEALDAALQMVHRSRGFFYEAELHRLKGDLLLLADPEESVDEAEACFQQALDLAQSQQAKSLELRAAMSLGRLWQGQGKGAKARKLLAGVYGWFKEGFGTPDLQEAKALLEEWKGGKVKKPTRRKRAQKSGSGLFWDLGLKNGMLI